LAEPGGGPWANCAWVEVSRGRFVGGRIVKAPIFTPPLGLLTKRCVSSIGNISVGFEKPVHRGAYKKFTSHVPNLLCSACLPVGSACRARLSCPPAVPARCTPCRARLPCLPAVPLPCLPAVPACLPAMPVCHACVQCVPAFFGAYCLSICVSIFWK
jgi:hypothetical protein